MIKESGPSPEHPETESSIESKIKAMSLEEIHRGIRETFADRKQAMRETVAANQGNFELVESNPEYQERIAGTTPENDPLKMTLDYIEFSAREDGPFSLEAEETLKRLTRILKTDQTEWSQREVVKSIDDAIKMTFMTRIHDYHADFLESGKTRNEAIEKHAKNMNEKEAEEFQKEAETIFNDPKLAKLVTEAEDLAFHDKNVYLRELSTPDTEAGFRSRAIAEKVGKIREEVHNLGPEFDPLYSEPISLEEFWTNRMQEGKSIPLEIGLYFTKNLKESSQAE